ncbi:MAG: 6-bladed beta-propeller [Acidobacteria bacterium]|nr:6-bladed beta-propeller [Acidobacteriota bacterium]
MRSAGTEKVCLATRSGRHPRRQYRDVGLRYRPVSLRPPGIAPRLRVRTLTPARLAGDNPGGALPLGLSVLIAVLSGCQSPAPEYWALEAAESLAVGVEPVRDETAFFRPTALGVDGQNSLYVLDSGNDRIQVFDLDGQFKASLGRSGAGPGDLSAPEDMWVDADGSLIVADTGNRRLAFYGADGEPGVSTPLEFVPVGLAGSPDRVYVLRLPTAAMLFGPETEPLVYAFNRSGMPIDGAVEPTPHPTGIVYFLANTHRIAADVSSGFALADVHVKGRVRRYGSDLVELGGFGVLYKANALAPLDWLPRHVDEESVQRIARPILDLRWDPYLSLFWVLAGYVDREADGTWVQGVEVHRYSADGDYRGTVPLPIPALRIAPTPDGSLWALDREGAVRRYRIRDPEGAATWR